MLPAEVLAVRIVQVYQQEEQVAAVTQAHRPLIMVAGEAGVVLVVRMGHRAQDIGEL